MNNEGSSNFFRESFRGFNKDDVAEYIAKLSRDYTTNEEKYKETIVKLTAELKAKSGETGDANISQSYDDSELTDKINLLEIDSLEKDDKITALQSQIEQLQSSENTSELSLQIEKYKETIESLSKEITELNEQGSENPESMAINQLSFQLAESESEKLFISNMLKKFIVALDIESARDKNVWEVSNMSDIAPKAKIAEEIEAGLDYLVQLKEKASDLEVENALLQEQIDTQAEAGNATRSNEEELYKQIMSKLGETVYSANKTAEDTVNRAKVEADEIIEKARIEEQLIVDKANINKAVILEENKKNTEKIKGSYEFIKREHDDMVRKYKAISDAYALNLAELEDTINIICDSISDDNFNGQ